MNFKSDLATKVEIFNFLTSGLKYILSSSTCLSGLEMGVNTVCTLIKSVPVIPGPFQLLGLTSF